jgi:hypothetical protein
MSVMIKTCLSQYSLLKSWDACALQLTNKHSSPVFAAMTWTVKNLAACMWQTAHHPHSHVLVPHRVSRPVVCDSGSQGPCGGQGLVGLDLQQKRIVYCCGGVRTLPWDTALSGAGLPCVVLGMARYAGCCHMQPLLCRCTPCIIHW